MPTLEQRNEIGKLAKEDFFTNHKKLGYYCKKKANPDDGDFMVLNYPTKYTKILDSIIFKYLNPLPERKRTKIKKQPERITINTVHFKQNV